MWGPIAATDTQYQMVVTNIHTTANIHFDLRQGAETIPQHILGLNYQLLPKVRRIEQVWRYRYKAATDLGRYLKILR